MNHLRHYAVLAAFLAGIATPARAEPKNHEADVPDPRVKGVMAYIRASYPKTVRVQKDDAGKMIGVPYPYTVPSLRQRFQELYYWDTFFTNLGLNRLGMRAQALNNVKDLLALVDRFGLVPNANRRSMLNRSQTPFLAMMLRDVVDDSTDRAWLAKAYATVTQEYDFWMTKRLAPLGLNRPGNSADEAALLLFGDYLQRNRFRGHVFASREDKLEFSRQALSECEVWDFSPRFSRRAGDWCPVDMNSNLYLYETILAGISRRLGNGDESAWLEKAEARKKLVQQYCWNDSLGCFSDYDYVRHAKGDLVSCATLYPLFAGLATSEQAARVVAVMRDKLEYEHGLSTCEKRPQPFVYQWDYPNAWPPLQYIAVQALENYGYRTDALRIARKYVNAVCDNFERTGGLWEKYNAVTGRTDVRDEHPYEMPQMLGWTAGVFVACVDYLDRHGSSASPMARGRAPRPDKAGGVAQ